MPGGLVTLVEKRGAFELYCYGSARFPGWAVFEQRPGKEPKIINGKWSDVFPEYIRLTQTPKQCN